MLPSFGYIATPMLTEIAGYSLSAARCREIRLATMLAAWASDSGRMSVNSSPPYRAAVSIARE